MKALLPAPFFLLLCVVPAVANPYAPPDGYYDTTVGVGDALRDQLHDIIDGHTVVSYNSARFVLQETDQVLGDPDSILLAYENRALDVSGLFGNGIPGWDSGRTWNREHTWPRSRGVDSSGPDNSDLHQLRPVDPDINTSRGNRNFGGAFGQPFGITLDDGVAIWYPGDADAGHVARSLFYMDVRYDGSDGSTEDLSLLPGNPSSAGLHVGNLDRLIEWHYLAPPTDFELRRNDVIYDYQNNRNPFIDRPELAWSVFVDQENDSQLSISGAEVAADGSSSAAVDLGRVLVGASLSPHELTLNKFGDDATYFNVTTAGSASSTLSGRYNAFAIGATEPMPFAVSIDTSTPSAQIGMVTIDNLDVTPDGGEGRGANDGNDVVTLRADVLDHGVPSFDEDVLLSALTIDFGQVVPGSSLPIVDVELFNLEQTLGYTAGWVLTNVTADGDAETLTVDLLSNGVVAAGEAAILQATLQADEIGEYAAEYVLRFEDEELPGAMELGSLMLQLTGEVVAGLPGDFNGDGVVDGHDLLVWQRGESPSRLAADDLEAWSDNFGLQSGAGTISVPEPPTLAALAILFCAIAIAAGRVNARHRG